MVTDVYISWGVVVVGIAGACAGMHADYDASGTSPTVSSSSQAAPQQQHERQRTIPLDRQQEEQPLVSSEHTIPEYVRQSWQWMPEQCSICLMDITEEEKRAKAHPANGCRHTFHWSCLIDSLVLDTTCPNCRREYSQHGVYEIDGCAKQINAKLHLPDKHQRSQVVDASETPHITGIMGQQPNKRSRNRFLCALFAVLFVVTCVLCFRALSGAENAALGSSNRYTRAHERRQQRHAG